ncbi:unnamed protein product, partial [Rotaria sordida]
KLKLPLSLVYLKIHSNDDMPPSLFHSLSTLKRLQTLIVDNRKQVEYTFHVDTAVFSRNIKILQLKNIATSISSIYDCEELTQLKYLELRLTEAGETFHHMSFTYPSSLKTLIIHFQLSFTDLEYVLSGCVEGNLKHLELYSQTNTSQMDYFDQKRWCKLFERFQNLTKCRIQLQQRVLYETSNKNVSFEKFSQDFQTYTNNQSQQDYLNAQNEANQDNIFGVPTFIVRGEPFFGNDRISWLKKRLDSFKLHDQ